MPIVLLTPWPGAIAAAAVLAAAAASPVWIHGGACRVTVMVDLSPSTRGADYRDRHRLNARIAQLLGDTPFDRFAFAGNNVPLPAEDVLPDLPTDRTVFAPPPGQPVLLFSDGRFEPPPESPPVFAVIDPQLISPDDSAVASLEVIDNLATAVVQHAGPRRDATWRGTGTAGPTRIDAPVVLSTSVENGNSIGFSLNPGDRWPENDSLSSLPLPPEHRPRWWIGDRDPGPGWLHLRPSQLPSSPVAWLDPSVIVLDDVAADALGRVQQDSLQRFARDLGGSVILLGGEHAFAAGGYAPTPIGAISPLADGPPKPAARWVILIDASGSMAARSSAGGSLFDQECAAARSLLPLLPAADLLRVGSFAREAQWWFDGPVAAALDQSFPPAGSGPNGPTALQPALQSAFVTASAPTRVLLMTDADTDAVDVNPIPSNARLLVLALGHGSALPSLAELSRRSGGSVVEQPDPTRWAASARDLLKAQLPDHFEQSHVSVTFAGELKSLGSRPIDRWNHTWLKRDAAVLATTSGGPMAARWQVGVGAVAAVAYAMSPQDAAVLADHLGSDVGDPRFTVRWDTHTARPWVSVTAVESDRFLNGQLLGLTSIDPESGATEAPGPIPQVAPGRYELELPRSSGTRYVRVSLGSLSLDRRAIAGRYAEEFDAIGVDRAKLQDLTDRSGGAVVTASQTSPLRIAGVLTQTSLAEALLAGGSGFIAGGLWRWKRGGRARQDSTSALPSP